MIRRKHIVDQQHADRWLISYADFITLLFAFFVVMYSISQVNEGKYRVLSESMVAAFDLPERSMRPIEKGNINRTNVPASGDNNNLPGNETPGELAPGGIVQADQNKLSQLNATAQQTKQQFKALQTSLRHNLKDLIDRGVVDIQASDDWIEIEVPSGLLFSSGSDRLGNSALTLLHKIAELVARNNNLIRIRGFTDNVPAGGRFRSNWALSAARSVAVVQVLQKFGIEPQRLALEGYGAYAPVASNRTVAGRSRNRRVVLAISRYIRGKLTPLPLAENGKATGSGTKPEPFELIRDKQGALIIRGKRVDKKGKNLPPQKKQATKPAT